MSLTSVHSLGDIACSDDVLCIKNILRRLVEAEQERQRLTREPQLNYAISDL